jgi:signal transduction histidine kinase
LATQAGISIGDTPIEINNQPAQDFLRTYEKAGTLFGLSVTKLSVVDDTGKVKLVDIENSHPSSQHLIELTILFFVCLVFWIVGFYVLLKKSWHTLALLLCLCGAIFGLTISSGIATETAIPTALHFQVAAIIGPWLLLHFFLVLPEERIRVRNSPLIYLIYLPPAITLILYPIIGYADGQSLPWFRSFRLFEYGVAFTAIAGVVIFNYFRAVSIKTRQQMKIVLISCLAALVPFLLLFIIPEAIEGQTILPAGFNIVFLAFIPLGMGYAITTQKLMDIDVVIRRGVVYGLVTVIMAGILSVAFFFVATKHTSVLMSVHIITALVLGGVAAALFGPIKKWMEKLIDRLFYKDRYDYRQIIEILSKSLSSVKDLNDVSRVIVGTLVNALNLEGCCLFVKTQSNNYEVVAAQGTFINVEKQRILSKLISFRYHEFDFPNSASGADPDLEFIIPLIAAEKEVGILCISPKVSRQKFSSADIYLIQGIASTASITLRSAALVRDVSLRDNFVSIASHELRTPMSTIMGYTELLLKHDPPDTTRKQWLENIMNSGKSINVMVDDLLNVTRIQSGKISILIEEVELSKLFYERLAFIQDTTSKHVFIINIETNLPTALVDRDKFGQVIGNLLSNAVKYSPGGGRITISAYYDKRRNYILVSVADEGIGISSEDKKALFTTFHRIQRPETQGIRGSGLGLYIAKEWTEAMGGEIWLESELNKGSTFFVSIPAKASKK